MGDRKEKLKRYFELYAIAAKMDLAWLLRDTKYALISILAELISNLSAVGGVYLLAWRFDGVGGMSKYEVLFMLGYVTIISGVYTTFFGANNGHISRIIGRGQMEHLFIQPLPLHTQLLTSGFYPFTGGSCNILSGGVILAMALRYLSITPPWWWVMTLLLSIATTMLIILSQNYLYSTLAFYAPVAAEEITWYVYDLSSDLAKYPLSGMPLAVQVPLLTLFPAGLTGWFPTMALLGKPPMGAYFYPAVFAMILFVITQYLFRKGLKFYVKTGTNRYLPFGYRR